MKQNTLFFIGFGSLCTYQYPALRAINQQISLKGIFYQTRKEVMPEGFIRQGEDFLKVIIFGNGLYFKKIPRPIFRLMENLYIILSGLGQIIKTDLNDQVFITGYLFFIWIPILRLKFRRVIVWKFGVAEEFLISGKMKDMLKFYFIKGIEKIALPLADAFVVQSNGMREYVQKTFHAYSKPIYKIPCCVDFDLFRFTEEGRRKARKDLGLEGRFVVIHIGSGSSWRSKNAIIEVFNAIKSKREDAFLLIVTRDTELKNMIRDQRLIDSKVISFKLHEDVAKALWASDLALLLNIEDHPATKVMSPIKLPEYLATGLSVIISGTSKEYLELLEKRDIGLAININSNEWKYKLHGFMDYLEKNTDLIRKNSSNSAKELLSWQAMKQVVKKAFILDSI